MAFEPIVETEMESQTRRQMPRAPRLPPIAEVASITDRERLEFASEVQMPTSATRAPLEHQERPSPVAIASSEPSDACTRIIERMAWLHRDYLAAAKRAQAGYLDMVRGTLQGGINLPAPSIFPEMRTATSAVALQTATATPPSGDAALATWMEVRGDELFLSLDKAPWLKDHAPDYGEAVVPMTGVAEIMAACAQAARPGEKVIEVSSLRLTHWILVCDEPLRLKRVVEQRPDGTLSITLLTWREAKRKSLSRDEPLATAIVTLAAEYPVAPTTAGSMKDETPSHDPYKSGALFHGPAFQLVSKLASAPTGAVGKVDLDRNVAPVGAVHPVALDASLQVAADRRWDEWCPGVREGEKCVPLEIRRLRFFAPTPCSGELDVEVRGAGVEMGPRFPVLRYQVRQAGIPWAEIEMVSVVTPDGPMNRYSDDIRQRFMRDRVFIPQVHLSSFEGAQTHLDDATVGLANWVPGTVEAVWAIQQGTDITAAVAAKEHVARHFSVHPSRIEFDGHTAHPAGRPDLSVALIVRRADARVCVSTE